MAIVLAILEIQIEGEDGWAKNLPTWRPSPNKWYAKLYSKALSGKELTGYHICMFTFVFLNLNLPYIFGFPLTLENWLKTFSLFILFAITWDFLWFVFNPNYPITHFGKEDKINHIKWVWRIPTDYIFGIILSGIILLPMATSNPSLLLWWIKSIGLFILETFLAVLVSIYILKIHTWHKEKQPPSVRSLV